jgi:hypothetical protein
MSFFLPQLFFTFERPFLSFFEKTFNTVFIANRVKINKIIMFMAKMGASLILMILKNSPSFSFLFEAFFRE